MSLIPLNDPVFLDSETTLPFPFTVSWLQENIHTANVHNRSKRFMTYILGYQTYIKIRWGRRKRDKRQYSGFSVKVSKSRPQKSEIFMVPSTVSLSGCCKGIVILACTAGTILSSDAAAQYCHRIVPIKALFFCPAGNKSFTWLSTPQSGYPSFNAKSIEPVTSNWDFFACCAFKE